MLAGKRIIDISLPLSARLPIWPGDPPIAVEPALRVARGDGANVSRLALGTHTGTHCDPPRHFSDEGAATDALDLGALIGPATVLDFTRARGTIGAADLAAAGVPAGAARVLLKTGGTAGWEAGEPAFDPDFTGLAPDGARWLIARGIRLVGIDTLSIERHDAPPDGPTHTALLAAGVVIVEGLDLAAVAPGAYTLIFLPLKIADGDGAPGRAVLIED